MNRSTGLTAIRYRVDPWITCSFVHRSPSVLHYSFTMAILRFTPRVQVLLAVLLLTSATYLIASYPSSSSFPLFPVEPGFTYKSEPIDGEPKKIAIIGAGASGSAAAWFLSRAGRVMKERTGQEVLGEITVFERDTRIGGRTSVKIV